MPRHEAVGVLHNPTQQASFRNANIFGRRHDHRVDRARSRRRRTEPTCQPILDSRHLVRCVFRAQHCEGIRHGRRSERDDAVLYCQPGGRFNRRRRQPFEPIGFGEDRCRSNNQRRGLRWPEGVGDPAPVGNRSRTWRRGLIPRQEEYLAVAGATRRHDGALRQGEPQNTRLAIMHLHIGCVERRKRGQNDKVGRGRHRRARIAKLHGCFPSNWSRRKTVIEDDEGPSKTSSVNASSRSQIIPTSLIIAAVLGFLLVVYLIIDSGAAQVAHAMLVVGWWLIPITLFHLFPLVFSALSWRELLPSASRPDATAIIWIRWIRESINSLLPVAGVGGDFASIRLAHLQGVPGVQAAASMVVDTTVGVVTQLIFVLSGVGLLLMRSTERSTLVVAWTVLIGTGVFFVAIAAFVLFQHRGLFGGFAKFARRLLPDKWLSAFAASASAIDDAVVASYRCGWAMLRASLWRLVGWAAGAGEVWLVMQSLGHPIGMIDAFVLESLSSGVRAAAFMVPRALGVLE